MPKILNESRMYALTNVLKRYREAKGALHKADREIESIIARPFGDLYSDEDIEGLKKLQGILPNNCRAVREIQRAIERIKEKRA